MWKIKIWRRIFKWKKNGKCKEYYDYNGKLIFEGEYLNGKKTGKCKEYDNYYGYLKFEGEYLSGKKMENAKNIFMINYHLKENI